MPQGWQYSMKLKLTEDAFTLIELLVVIAIIGLLASIVLVALNSARAKARAAKRVGDLKEIQSALELYYNDNNSYPNTSSYGNWLSRCAGWYNVGANGAWIPGLAPTYIQNLPSDPIMNISANQNCYLYTSNGSDYKILDYNITDMTASQITGQYSSFADPYRNGGNQTLCPGSSEGTPTLAIWSGKSSQCW